MFSHYPKRYFGLIALSFFMSLCCGCGGGGGGSDGSGSSSNTLTVSVSYLGDAYVLRSSSIVPTMSGFNGHSPNCSLKSGALPNGMTLNSNCSITGVPTEVGNFGVTVQVGADGVSNTVDVGASFMVWGPSIDYNIGPNLGFGDVVDSAPINQFWVPGNETVVYSLESGSLPAGLTLNSSTGHIQGQVAAQGAYTFSVRASVSSGNKTADARALDPAPSFFVNAPSFGYDMGSLWAGESFSATTNVSYQGGTHHYSISKISDGTSTLPAGLTFDPNTGKISGVATEVPMYPIAYTVSMTGNLNGANVSLSTDVTLSVQSPVYVYYPGGYVAPGSISVAPVITINHQDPSGSLTWTFAMSAGNSLPAGLSLDPATGVISGTAAVLHTGLLSIDVSVTNHHTGATIVTQTSASLDTL